MIKLVHFNSFPTEDCILWPMLWLVIDVSSYAPFVILGLIQSGYCYSIWKDFTHEYLPVYVTSKWTKPVFISFKDVYFFYTSFYVSLNIDSTIYLNEFTIHLLCQICPSCDKLCRHRNHRSLYFRVLEMYWSQTDKVIDRRVSTRKT